MSITAVRNCAGVLLSFFFWEMKISVDNRQKLPSIIANSDGFQYSIFLASGFVETANKKFIIKDAFI